MAIMGQEQAVPATRILINAVGAGLDVPTTVLQKEVQHMNTVALNQLHNLLKAVYDELGCDEM